MYEYLYHQIDDKEVRATIDNEKYKYKNHIKGVEQVLLVMYHNIVIYSLI